MVAAVVGVIGERAAVVAAEGEGRRKALVVLLATKTAMRHAVLIMTTTALCF